MKCCNWLVILYAKVSSDLHHLAVSEFLSPTGDLQTDGLSKCAAARSSDRRKEREIGNGKGGK